MTHEAESSLIDDDDDDLERPFTPILQNPRPCPIHQENVTTTMEDL
jgi:hypothetical protein